MRWRWGGRPPPALPRPQRTTPPRLPRRLPLPQQHRMQLQRFLMQCKRRRCVRAACGPLTCPLRCLLGRRRRLSRPLRRWQPVAAAVLMQWLTLFWPQLPAWRGRSTRCLLLAPPAARADRPTLRLARELHAAGRLPCPAGGKPALRPLCYLPCKHTSFPACSSLCALRAAHLLPIHPRFFPPAASSALPWQPYSPNVSHRVSAHTKSFVVRFYPPTLHSLALTAFLFVPCSTPMHLFPTNLPFYKPAGDLLLPNLPKLSMPFSAPKFISWLKFLH